MCGGGGVGVCALVLGGAHLQVCYPTREASYCTLCSAISRYTVVSLVFA